MLLIFSMRVMIVALENTTKDAFIKELLMTYPREGAANDEWHCQNVFVPKNFASSRRRRGALVPRTLMTMVIRRRVRVCVIKVCVYALSRKENEWSKRRRRRRESRKKEKINKITEKVKKKKEENISFDKCANIYDGK